MHTDASVDLLSFSPKRRIRIQGKARILQSQAEVEFLTAEEEFARKRADRSYC
jgi:hypothetical protein